MTRYTAVDLSQLALPDVVEALDFEAVLTARLADLSGRAPDLADVLALESDPLVKLQQVDSYRETLLRARINDAARACMLATATGADLDNLAALFGVVRLTVDPGDAQAVPPVPPTLETDAALRLRAQLALEGFSTAGPRGAYEFHARSADPRVKDVAVEGDQGTGVVNVTVLSADGDGSAAPDLLAAVDAALNGEDVRPVCDLPIVSPAGIVSYTVEAVLQVEPGPSAEALRTAAEARLMSMVDDRHRIGLGVPLSAIYGALHMTGQGIREVVLTAPVADVDVTATQAAFCSGATVTAEVVA
jgi:phage-related baseplate assembly protein